MAPLYTSYACDGNTRAESKFSMTDVQTRRKECNMQTPGGDSDISHSRGRCNRLAIRGYVAQRVAIRREDYHYVLQYAYSLTFSLPIQRLGMRSRVIAGCFAVLHRLHAVFDN